MVASSDDFIELLGEVGFTNLEVYDRAGKKERKKNDWVCVRGTNSKGNRVLFSYLPKEEEIFSVSTDTETDTAEDWDEFAEEWQFREAIGEIL